MNTSSLFTGSVTKIFLDPFGILPNLCLLLQTRTILCNERRPEKAIAEQDDAKLLLPTAELTASLPKRRDDGGSDSPVSMPFATLLSGSSRLSFRLQSFADGHDYSHSAVGSTAPSGAGLLCLVAN